MFYSQFILAKKGPLGTIWIAAHLERKLRKNQVADTDIGVSVDSILSPEVPIALRLSSHLLLGVVRIYSRKVNYLFHDCSEALLKIKQAFRSTAVDLPPEESTAPYHSITLPETFDLDDFELPDTAILHGNFDHHVSTREQITLQDTVGGSGYSSTQFGLDERFGDGDAYQVGLDLEEELFLEKDPAHPNASAPSEDIVENQISGIPDTPFANMDTDDFQDDCDEDKATEALKDLIYDRSYPKGADGSSSLQGYNVRTPDLNEIFFPSENTGGPSVIPNHMDMMCSTNGGTDLLDHAQAPSTPKLLEEAIPVHLQETPALSHLGKISPSNDMEYIMTETIRPQSEYHYSSNENGCQSSLPQCSSGIINEAVELEILPDHSRNSCGSSVDKVSHSEATDITHRNSKVLADECTIEASNLNIYSGSFLDVAVKSKLFASGNEHASVETSDIGNELSKEKDNLQELSQHEHAVGVDVDPSLSDQPPAPTADCLLRPYSSENQINAACVEFQEMRGGNRQLVTETLAKDKVQVAVGLLLEQQGEGFCPAGFKENDPKAVQMSGFVYLGSKEDINKSINLPADVLSNGTRLEALNCSAMSEYPEPERMLLAPTGNHGLPNEIEQYTAEKGVTESDGSVNVFHSLSSKNSRLVESTPTLLNGSSVKLSGLPRSKRKASYIPDDDDLLASILGGRTPAFKVKPTPSLQSVLSSKRPRLGPKAGVPKRKVLLDDTMVLHADAIRQQLLNTEDIRRIRKKAPCTRSEIWMIEKFSLEDEIFGESVLTGMSEELSILHFRIYNRNGTHEPRVGADVSHSNLLKVDLLHSSAIVGVTNAEHSHSHSVISKVGLFDSSETVGEDGSKGMDKPVMSDSDKNVNGPPEHSGTQLLIETQHLENSRDALVHAAQKHVTTATDTTTQEELLSDNLTHSVVSAEASQGGYRNDGLEKNFDTVDVDSFVEKEASIGERHNDTEASALMSGDLCLHPEEMQGTLKESVPTLENASHFIENVHNTEDGRTDSENRSVVVNETAVDCQDFDGGAHVNAVKTSEWGPIDNQVISSSCEPVLHPATDIITSTIGETSYIQESNLETTIDVENAEVVAATRDSCLVFQDFGSAVDEDDTEFLNVDDEVDFDEEVNYDEPNSEDAQSIENSGWSARTRGVARYLKLLFDEESGRGRRNVGIDRLLAGKTRKEASRMFFETLVLKTKDYIHVEQENSFANIDIKPRAKLLKSDF